MTVSFAWWHLSIALGVIGGGMVLSANWRNVGWLELPTWHFPMGLLVLFADVIYTITMVVVKGLS